MTTTCRSTWYSFVEVYRIEEVLVGVRGLRFDSPRVDNGVDHVPWC